MQQPPWIPEEESRNVHGQSGAEANQRLRKNAASRQMGRNSCHRASKASDSTSGKKLPRQLADLISVSLGRVVQVAAAVCGGLAD